MSKKVLIIDDSYFARTLIKNALKTVGYETYEAKNGHEGISKFFELYPDLVTMDINMPEMDGIETTKRILAKDPAAKIIAVTGSNSDEIKKSMLGAGAKDYLTKPFQPAFILNKIENMFLTDIETQPSVEKIHSQDISEKGCTQVKEFDLPDTPDESRNRPIVITNDNDDILFPPDSKPEDSDKYALTSTTMLDEISQNPTKKEFKRADVDLQSDANQLNDSDVEVQQHATPSSDPLIEKELPNSYLQIRPPRGKILSPSMPVEPIEDLVEPIINDSGVDISVPKQKLGLLSKIKNIFLKKT